MPEAGYPVVWRGRKFVASDLTDGLKAAFCKWLYNHMLDNARERMTYNAYQRYENKLTAAPPEWTTDGEVVIAAFTQLKPRRQLIRLILAVKTPDEDAEIGMSDDELDRLIMEKEADQTSDFVRAMNQIKENMDPKASRAVHGSAVPAAENEPTLPSVVATSA